RPGAPGAGAGATPRGGPFSGWAPPRWWALPSVQAARGGCVGTARGGPELREATPGARRGEREEAGRGRRARRARGRAPPRGANCISRRPGQRFGTLRTIAQAQELGGPSPELRTEAIAALSLPDLELIDEWHGLPTGTSWWCFDGCFARYARMDETGNVSVHR